jgi:hypothetical protein
MDIKFTSQCMRNDMTNIQQSRLQKRIMKARKDKEMKLKIDSRGRTMRYRTTPHSVRGRAPAKLFLKRLRRTKFSLLKPNLQQETEKKQEKQKEDHDKRRVKFREFAEGQKVLGQELQR